MNLNFEYSHRTGIERFARCFHSDSGRHNGARQSMVPDLLILSAPAPVPDEPSTIPAESPAPSACLPRSHIHAPGSNRPAQTSAPRESTPQNFSSPPLRARSANKEFRDYSTPPDTRAAPIACSSTKRARRPARQIVCERSRPTAGRPLYASIS